MNSTNAAEPVEVARSTCPIPPSINPAQDARAQAAWRPGFRRCRRRRLALMNQEGVPSNGFLIRIKAPARGLGANELGPVRGSPLGRGHRENLALALSFPCAQRRSALLIDDALLVGAEVKIFRKDAMLSEHIGATPPPSAGVTVGHLSNTSELTSRAGRDCAAFEGLRRGAPQDRRAGSQRPSDRTDRQEDHRGRSDRSQGSRRNLRPSGRGIRPWMIARDKPVPLP